VNELWFTVHAVIEHDFSISTPLAAFPCAEQAVEWGRDNYPYSYLIRTCQPPVPNEGPKINEHDTHSVPTDG
jgi:hypothetical protein